MTIKGLGVKWMMIHSGEYKFAHYGCSLSPDERDDKSNAEANRRHARWASEDNVVNISSASQVD
jgi:hypothetical protein